MALKLVSSEFYFKCLGCDGSLSHVKTIKRLMKYIHRSPQSLLVYEVYFKDGRKNMFQTNCDLGVFFFYQVLKILSKRYNVYKRTSRNILSLVYILGLIHTSWLETACWISSNLYISVFRFESRFTRVKEKIS